MKANTSLILCGVICVVGAAAGGIMGQPIVALILCGVGGLLIGLSMAFKED